MIEFILKEWGQLKYLMMMIFMALLLFMGISHGESVSNQKWQAKWNAETARHAEQLAAASEKQRAIEQRYQTELEDITHDAQQKIDAAAADAAAANDESDRLRNTAAELAKRSSKACADAATAAGSKAADTAAVVLADVLGRIESRANQLAEAADRARIAGLACQQSYDAIRSSQQ